MIFFGRNEFSYGYGLCKAFLRPIRWYDWVYATGFF